MNKTITWADSHYSQNVIIVEDEKSKFTNQIVLKKNSSIIEHKIEGLDTVKLNINEIDSVMFTEAKLLTKGRIFIGTNSGDKYIILAFKKTPITFYALADILEYNGLRVIRK